MREVPLYTQPTDAGAGGGGGSGADRVPGGGAHRAAHGHRHLAPRSRLPPQLFVLPGLALSRREGGVEEGLFKAGKRIHVSISG